MGILEYAAVLVFGVVVGLLSFRALHRSHSPEAPPPEQDEAVREARGLREESRETRIRIDATVKIGKPTAELFDDVFGGIARPAGRELREERDGGKSPR